MAFIDESDIRKGQAVYTPFALNIYNAWVLDVSNSWIWRCSKKIQLEQYNNHVSANHLDIGVGTGYYLQACQSPSLSQLSLMDLNQNCLNTTFNVLKKRQLSPTTYLADIFKSQPFLAEQFNSISMNYLLHCLPGTMKAKEICLANATAMLASGGILFGATILSDEELQTKASKFLAKIYNKKGIFCNQNDKLETLHEVLKNQLVDVDISVIGCVALFKGKRISNIST
ncbi:MAG: class I SAM-dependent methyltransferase [Tatlockia sp.]|nr:class I SAM-dependent methyltransferase [Tatlockia sp.]